MNEQEQQKAFDAAVKTAAKQRNIIQKNTADDVVALLKKAFSDVEEKLKAQPSDYQLWSYPYLKRAIGDMLAEFGEKAGEKASAGQATAWEAGQDLIDTPFEAANVPLKAVLPQINNLQLLAMQSFLTSKMQNVGATALAKIDAQLGLTIIGSQGIEDTILGIQAAETMSRKRAITIIRTELGRAYATASHERLIQATQHIPNVKKKWRRSGKIHSRRNHDLADGQIRPADKPFIMGTGAVIDGHEGNGARLMYPHDPRAPASETVNCGCMSLPFMDSWKQDGVLKDPGKRAFTAQEIALNPAKAEYAEMEAGPTLDEILKEQA